MTNKEIKRIIENTDQCRHMFEEWLALYESKLSATDQCRVSWALCKVTEGYESAERYLDGPAYAFFMAMAVQRMFGVVPPNKAEGFADALRVMMACSRAFFVDDAEVDGVIPSDVLPNDIEEQSRLLYFMRGRRII